MATLVLRNVKGTPLTNAEVDSNFSNLNSEKIERDGSVPFIGKQTFVQSGSARASFRLPEGSADPTIPEVGDIWNNAGTLKFRIAAGTTVDLVTTGGDNNFDGNVSVGGNLVVDGTLTVNGTVTTVNSTVVTVDDKNIELGSVTTPTNITADLGGITLKGATDKTFNWVNATTSWTSSENLDLASGRTYRIFNQLVLSATTVGPNVVNSSLQTLGTITAGVWNGTAIPFTHGGTGLTATPTNGQIPVGNGAGYTLATLSGTTNQIAVTNAAGSITLALPQSINTAAGVQFGSFGVGTAASGVTGEIRATNEITAYFTSDMRLKENVVPLANALDLVKDLGGYSFDWIDSHINERGGEDGFFVRKHDVGLIAQEVRDVLPEAVATRENGYLAVKYERVIPLLVEAIKELSAKVDRISHQ